MRNRWSRSIVLGQLLLLPVLGNYLRDIHFDNNVRDWLPHGDQDARILDWHDEQFDRYDTFLISWDDSSLNDPRVEQLAGALTEIVDENGKRPVESVATPQRLLERMDTGLPREEAIRRLEGVLIGTGYLKVRLTEAGREADPPVSTRIVDYASQELDIDADILPPLIEHPLPAAADDDAEPFPAIPEHDFQVHWRGIFPGAAAVEPIQRFCRELREGDAALVDDCFFAPGAPVAIFVRLRTEGSEELPGVFAAVRAAARDAGIDEAAFHMGGTPVGAWQLDVESTKSVWNRTVPIWMFHKRSPFLLSGIVGMLVAFLLLKSVRLASLVLAVSMISSAICVVLVPASGGTLNIVLSVMPNLLLVLTASGAIHVANYWRHATQAGAENPIAAAVRIAWRPCGMASFTTAVGMASLMVSTLVPVRDFGKYSALGTVLSLVMILVVFPAVLDVLGGAQRSFRSMDTSRWHTCGHWIARHHWFVTAAFTVLLAGGVFGLRWFRTETKAIRYFPEHARIVQDYYALEESLAGVVTVDTVISFDADAQERLDLVQRLELIRAIEGSLHDLEGVSGTLSVADFREESEPLAEDAGTARKILYRRKLQRLEQELFGEGKASSELVTHAGTDLEFERGGATHTISAGDEIWRIRAQTEMMGEVDYSVLVAQLDERISATLADQQGTEHVVTGMVPLFLRTQQAVLESLMYSFALAFVVIALTMMVLLRSFVSGLCSMFPNVWPVFVVFGAISVAGVPVDIGTMITASVAMGIAIDGTVHLLTWFRQGILDGLSRREAVAMALSHCGPALFQTSATIALAMLMAIFTDLLVVARFGWMMSAAVTAALLADIVLTPALLAGPLGMLIERAARRPSNPETDIES